MNDCKATIGSSVDLRLGDCRTVLKELDDCSVDCVVTDPPYELGFMGKSWDKTGIAYDVEVWKECLRVLKPGGHLIAFGGSRTYHRLVCAVEDAGFEIRDQLLWIYAQGFPKSHDVSKAIDNSLGVERKVVGRKKAGMGSGKTFGMLQSEGCNNLAPREVDITAPGSEQAKRWEGWGSALKPAHEPAVLARKPFKGTLAKNVVTYGCGALNIAECRVGSEQRTNQPGSTKPRLAMGDGWRIDAKATQAVGRWPANLIWDGSPLVERIFPCSTAHKSKGPRGTGGIWSGRSNTPCGPTYSDDGSAGRYFYVPKVSPSERRLHGTEIVTATLLVCPENGTTQEVPVAQLMVDTDRLQPRVIDGCTTRKKGDDALSTFLFGRNTTEQYLQDCKSTTKTVTSSTTTSPTLNYLVHSLTNGYIPGASLGMMDGGSPAASAMQSNTLTITISKTVASALGVSNAVSQGLLRINVSDATSQHPTVKPVALMSYLIALVCPASAIVLDPFMGSGSTGVAAVKTGRRFIGIELDADYLAIAAGRLASMGEQQCTDGKG